MLNLEQLEAEVAELAALGAGGQILFYFSPLQVIYLAKLFRVASVNLPGESDALLATNVADGMIGVLKECLPPKFKQHRELLKDKAEG